MRSDVLPNPQSRIPNPGPIRFDVVSLFPDFIAQAADVGVVGRARERGLVGVDGLGMLLHQARPGFAAWFGAAPTVDAALREFVADDIPRHA